MSVGLSTILRPQVTEWDHNKVFIQCLNAPVCPFPRLWRTTLIYLEEKKKKSAKIRPTIFYTGMK